MTEAGILIGALDFLGRAPENFKNSKKNFFFNVGFRNAYWDSF